MKAFRLLILVVVIIGVSCAYAQVYPIPKEGMLVNDFSGILSSGQIQTLNAQLADFEKRTTIEFAVVTVSSLQGFSIEEFSLGLANAWGVGKKDKNNGVILLVAPNERKVRIEVGLGLEQQLSDNAASDIIQNTILPAFKSGNMGLGIINGVGAVIKTLAPINGASTNSNVRLRVIDPNRAQREKEQNRLAIAVLIFFGVAVSGFVLSFILSSILSTKKENREKLQNYRKTFNDLKTGFAKAKTMLEELESGNPTWDISGLRKELYLIDIIKIDSALDQIEVELMKFSPSSNIVYPRFELLDDNEEKIQKMIEIINWLYSSPSVMKTTSENLKHPDVQPKTKEKFSSVESQFKKVTSGESSAKSIHKDLKAIVRALKEIDSDVESDKKFADWARSKGPELLEDYKQKLEEAEKNAGTSSSQKAALRQAQDQYQQALLLSRNGGVNWVQVAIILLIVDSLCDKSSSYHSNSSFQNNHRSSNNETNSSIGGFGGFGGGMFKGGGASGGW